MTGTPLDRLTARQRDVIECAAEGWTSDEIADELGITRSVVTYHLAAASKRLGLTCNNKRLRLVALWIVHTGQTPLPAPLPKGAIERFRELDAASGVGR